MTWTGFEVNYRISYKPSNNFVAQYETSCKVVGELKKKPRYLGSNRAFSESERVPEKNLQSSPDDPQVAHVTHQQLLYDAVLKF